VATSTAAALGLAEIAVRVFATEPVYRAADGVPAAFQRSVATSYLVRDRILGFAPGPAWKGATGRRGFQNGAEYADGPGGLDVVLLGDSVIQSRLLERAMKQLLTGFAVRIWNAGIGGYNTLQEAYYLEHHTRVAPHVVVVAFCLNDFLPSMTIAGDPARRTMAQNLFEPIGDVSPFWFRHSALYRMVKLRVLLPHDVGNLWSADTVRRNRPVVSEGLRRIRRYAAEHAATLAVAVYPHLTGDDDYLRAAHDTVLEVLAELAVDAIDLKAIYDELGFDPSQLRMSPDDVVHPNAEGHLIAAAEIVRRLGPRLGLTAAAAERLIAERVPRAAPRGSRR
jgi:lysophospholipase L1-like esterase